MPGSALPPNQLSGAPPMPERWQAERQRVRWHVGRVASERWSVIRPSRRKKTERSVNRVPATRLGAAVAVASMPRNDAVPPISNELVVWRPATPLLHTPPPPTKNDPAPIGRWSLSWVPIAEVKSVPFAPPPLKLPISSGSKLPKLSGRQAATPPPSPLQVPSPNRAPFPPTSTKRVGRINRNEGPNWAPPSGSTSEYSTAIAPAPRLHCASAGRSAPAPRTISRSGTTIRISSRLRCGSTAVAVARTLPLSVPLVAGNGPRRTALTSALATSLSCGRRSPLTTAGRTLHRTVLPIGSALDGKCDDGIGRCFGGSPRGGQVGDHGERQEEIGSLARTREVAEGRERHAGPDDRRSRDQDRLARLAAEGVAHAGEVGPPGADCGKDPRTRRGLGLPFERLVDQRLTRQPGPRQRVDESRHQRTGLGIEPRQARVALRGEWCRGEREQEGEGDRAHHQLSVTVRTEFG